MSEKQRLELFALNPADTPPAQFKVTQEMVSRPLLPPPHGPGEYDPDWLDKRCAISIEIPLRNDAGLELPWNQPPTPEDLVEFADRLDAHHRNVAEVTTRFDGVNWYGGGGVGTLILVRMTFGTPREVLEELDADGVDLLCVNGPWKFFSQEPQRPVLYLRLHTEAGEPLLPGPPFEFPWTDFHVFADTPFEANRPEGWEDPS